LVTDGNDTQIYYLRAGNQNVFASPNYRTVGFRGNAGIKTLLGDIIVNQNLLIDTGVNFDVSTSNFMVALRGDWINRGTFTQRNGRVEFIGANPQVIGDVVSTTFYDLEINNIANVTVANGVTNSITVTNVLNLTAGKLLLNSDLNATGNITSNISNYIVTTTGKLNRNVAASDILYPIGSITQYAPVTLSGGNGNAVGMAFDDSPIPNLPSGATDPALGSWFMESPANNVRIRFESSGSTNSFSKIHQFNGTIWIAEPTNFNASPVANYTTTNLQTLGNFTYTIFNPPTGGAITILPTTLPNGKVGIPYNTSLTATGGGGTYTFTVTSGVLPNGLTLSPSGVLSGLPLEAVAGRAVVVTVSDGTLLGTQNYNLVIDKGDQYIDQQTFIYNSATGDLSVTSSSSLPVLFESTNTQIASIQGNILRINTDIAGEAFVVAFNAGNNDYNPTTRDTVMYINNFGLVNGLSEDLDKNIALYPNPNSQDYLHLIFKKSDIQVEEIIIQNTMGNSVIEIVNNDFHTINIQELKWGVYLLRIKTNKGVIVKRFIRL
jgi:hypothetical protein